MLPLTTFSVVIQMQQFSYYAPLYTVQVKFEFKFKILGQNWIYDEDLRLLTLKRKKWHNNVLSRRLRKYSFKLIFQSFFNSGHELSRADLKILQLELWLKPARLGLITSI